MNTINLVKSNEIGMRWTSGHRDQWTQCLVYVGSHWVTVDRESSAHNPFPSVSDLELSLDRQDAQIKPLVMPYAQQIVEFFNSVEEGEKSIQCS